MKPLKDLHHLHCSVTRKYFNFQCQQMVPVLVCILPRWQLVRAAAHQSPQLPSMGSWLTNVQYSGSVAKHKTVSLKSLLTVQEREWAAFRRTRLPCIDRPSCTACVSTPESKVKSWNVVFPSMHQVCISLCLFSWPPLGCRPGLVRQ